MSSLPVISSANTVMPRMIAGWIDLLVGTLLGFLAGKLTSGMPTVMPLVMCVVAFLGYYFLCEVFTARSLGKLLTGLVVVRSDGSPATVRDAAIRTAFRILEVNPFLLGALPAALCILFSEDRQRLGDRAASTIVVPAARLRRYRAKLAAAVS